MCINDIIMHFPGKIHHAYSNDNHWLPKWLDARRPEYLRDHEKPVLHTCQVGNISIMKVWPWPGHGTSGLNAVYTGLGMGYEKIVIAGIPLDNEGHYFDPPWKKTNYDTGDQYGMIRYWKNANLKLFQGRVKSLSGKTKEVLGSP